MKHFMVTTFVFLGFAGYELSGGADFEPLDWDEDPVETATAAPSETRDIPDESSVAAARAAVQPVSARVELENPTFAPTKAVAVEGAASVVPAVVQTAEVPAATPVMLSPAPVDSSTVDEPVSEPPVLIEHPMVRVATSRLNFRMGPGTGFGKLGQLRAGDEAVLLREDGGWAKIRTVEPVRVGWVSARFIRPTDSSRSGM